MNNSTYSHFSEELSSRASVEQQHSTMYEPDFTNFQLSEMGIKQEPADDDESEHNKTDVYYDEDGRRVQDTNYGNGNSHQVPAEKRNNLPAPRGSNPRKGLPVHPGYKWEDMNPIVRDPLCSTDSDLAYFWPVYVSNFRCANRNDELDSVREYFASKGLHVRWWFRQKGRYFYEFQRVSGIYDMLVYFVSEYDTYLAIRMCHRDSYNGYTLNVFPGRVPVYFEPLRSVEIMKKAKDMVYSEQFYENHVKSVVPQATITSVVKFDTKRGAMEFKRRSDMTSAVEKVNQFRCKPIRVQQQKQRFLEDDLLGEIELQLASNANVLQPNPNDRYLRMLLKGNRPCLKIVPQPSSTVIPRKKQPMDPMLRQWLKRQERRIVKSLVQGSEPICNNNRNKKRFKRLVRKVQNRFARGEIV